MLHSRRVRRYQEFLKTLRRPEPRLCLCPFHLHPRPWVPPPCRSSRPYGEPSLLLSRRFHSNPELPAHSSHTPVMERRSLSHHNKAQHSHYLQHLHHEEDLIKEAKRRVCNGDPLPKDMYNTVMKWSNRSTKAEDQARGAGHRKARKPHTRHSEPRKEPCTDLGKEEEKLRQELRNARELNQNNIYLLEENKRLMKKIQKLQQRAKRQGETGGVSRESVEPPRQDDVILSLKKKYEDLLQYVLKVEAENQKLNSLIGESGEGRGTDTETTRRTLTQLQEEIQTLRQQVMDKDENLMKYEQQVKTLKDSSIILQEALKKQALGDKRPEIADLEEEWMRRFSETREMYEEAIRGYKGQLEQTQKKVVVGEQDYTQQIDKLRRQLEKALSQLKAKEKKEAKVVEDELNHTRKEEQMDEVTSRTKISPNHHIGKSGNDPTKDMTSITHEGSPRRSNDARNNTHLRTTTTGHNKGDEKPEAVTVIRTDDMYSEALELIMRRLENLQINREEVEGMIGVIKSTISTSLQEWRDSFQHTKEQQDGDHKQLKVENEDLQRKLKGRNKKIESLQKQNQDHQRQNEKLLHQCSLLESRMATSHTTEQLGILSGLPQKVQEVEQQLGDTKELLHKAQVENQTLQNQVKQLEEKLGKKESKLRAEREQSLTREKETAGARESVSSLQHQLEEMSREMNQLREQVSTKDVILEHTSAQLEERIRECASLSSLADRYKLQQNQDSDRIHTQLSERETASHKQFLEAQAQASHYQAQVSALRTEKEHSEKSLRSTVRKLEEQVDQLHLKNSTLQRQLTTFTSTYHTLFSGVDLQPVTSTPAATDGLKGI